MPSDRDAQLERMEQVAQALGGLIGDAIEQATGTRKVGFFLGLFEFGEGGWTTYVSNAQRDDMIAFLDELRTKLTKDNH